MISQETRDYMALIEIANTVATVMQLAGFGDGGQTMIPGSGLMQTHVIAADGTRYTLTVTKDEVCG